MSGSIVVHEGSDSAMAGSIVQVADKILHDFIANRNAKVLTVKVSKKGNGFPGEIEIKRQTFSGDIELVDAPRLSVVTAAFYNRLLMRVGLYISNKRLSMCSRVEIGAGSLKEEVTVVHYSETESSDVLLIFKGN